MGVYAKNSVEHVVAVLAILNRADQVREYEADLRAYKALRDTMLEAHPEAFTSDAMTERHRRADDYVPRLGLERPEGGHLMLGAWRDAELLGAVGLEVGTIQDVTPSPHNGCRPPKRPRV